MELRKIPIHRSLHRPNLLLGAERELILLTGLAAFTLVFVAMSPPVMAIGAFVWGVGAGLLRVLAKKDPQMSKVYIRHIRYRRYYGPHSTPFRER